MANIWLIFNKKTALLSGLAVFFVVLDRYLKYLSLANVKLNLLGEWLKFSSEKNYGIAFSLPLGGIALNWLIGLIIVFLLGWGVYAVKEAKNGQFLALVVVVLGASSNLYDRLAYGAVIDYFSLRYFTIFNLADVLICLGVIGIFLSNLDRKNNLC